MMKKPLDIGDGYSCASYLPTAEVLAVTRPHAVHGMVELTGAAPFDESTRSSQTLVRAYRGSLADAASAFLRPTGRSQVTDARMNPDGSLTISFRVAPADGTARVAFSGRLQRPPYAEITDIAPLPSLAVDSEIATDADTPDELVVASAGLASHARISVHTVPAVVGRWMVTGEEHAEWSASILPDFVDGAGTLEMEFRIALSTENDPPYAPDRSHIEAIPFMTLPVEAGAIVNGIADYVRGCCALRVSPSESVIITDHRLLPLSWTRDAYYMALLLLLLRNPDDSATVERHLCWLWGPGRDTGVWMRSHLTNGRVKDPGLQGDQQLFPILELLDYRGVVGSWPALPSGASGWGPLVESALASLPLDEGTRLIASSENPADDPSEYPLLFSTQLVYLRVLDGLARLGSEIGLDVSSLEQLHHVVRTQTAAVFRADGPDGPLFAYEADGLGGVRFYADANDVPTALAPAWGFCEADDPHWLGTMRFAFSAANPGWAAGALGGLGSAHTPGVWPLGDVQEFVAARARGDHATEDRVLAKLYAIVAADGHLPESYNPEDGSWFARHWFGWPAAALGAALLSGGRIAT